MDQDEYRLENTYHFPNAIVRVHRPVLTEEEEQRRMEKFKEATARFLTAVYREREKQKSENEASA